MTIRKKTLPTIGIAFFILFLILVLSGLETCKRILQLRPGQKAIIVSGFSENEKIKEVQKPGAGPYAKKPYLLEQIGLAVRLEIDNENGRGITGA